MKRTLWILSLLTGLGGVARALSVPGVSSDTTSWSATATTINATATNADGMANPSGTLYFFGASIHSLGTVANGNLISDTLHGTTVVDPFPSSDAASAPAPTDTIQGFISPLLAKTTYYLYAQACPPASDPGIPRRANDLGCTDWQMLSAHPLLTTGFSDPNFAYILPADVNFSTAPFPPGFTAQASPTTDSQNILYWHMTLTDLTYGATSSVLTFAGSHTTQLLTDSNWNGLIPNTEYQIKEWFEYPYSQTSLTEGSTFYTTPEPLGILPGDGVLNVTSTTVTERFHNAADARWPNPIGSTASMQISVAGDFSETVRTASAPVVLGVSTEVFTITTKNLTPGTTYAGDVVYVGPRGGNAWERYGSHSFGLFVTSGTAPSPFNDPIFQEVLPTDVGFSSVTLKTKLSMPQPNVSAWHVQLRDIGSGATTQINFSPSDFTTVQSSLCVVVTNSLWAKFWPSDGYTATEWLDYLSGPGSALTMPPTFYLQPHPAGIPANPVSAATSHSLTVTVTNSSDPNFLNPASSIYILSVLDQNTGKVITSVELPFPARNSTAHLAITADGLQPKTTYRLRFEVQAFKGYNKWPNYGPYDIGFGSTLPPDLTVLIDTASVTMTSGTAILTDVVQSTTADHYIISYGSTTQHVPWIKGNVQAFYEMTGLYPDQPYQVQARVCTSIDDSLCQTLIPGIFTTQAAPVQIPSPPFDVGSSSITVLWQDSINAPGTLYRADVCSGASFANCYEVTGSTKAPGSAMGSMLLNGLTEGATYQISVQALNITGAPWPDSVPVIYPLVQTIPSSLLGILSTSFNLNGFPLDDTQICIPTGAALEVTFNRDLDTTSLAGGVVIQHQAYQINGTPLPWTSFSMNYSNPLGGPYVLTISPPVTGWPAGDPISVTLTTALHDHYPTYLQAPVTVSFVPWAQGLTRAQQLSSFVNAQSQGVAEAAAGALDPNTCTVLRTQFIAPANGISANISLAINPSLLVGLHDTAEELVSVRQGQRLTDSFAAPVNLRIPFPPNTPATPTPSLAVPISWTLVYLNPQTLQLQTVPGATSDGISVQGMVSQPGVYMIAQTLESTDVSAAYAYPVPYRSSMGIAGITFTNLGAGSRIRVFTPSGLKVWEVNVPVGQTSLIWNLHTDPVASGVYLYIIDGQNGKKEGKLIIIQ